ncbi:DNA-directed RNA polymerase subunit beta'' (apicoplast) [Babesia divergens]|uniref:DNA-directed RNA polymerase subunit beta n=1 Tax=Babesia divergens TaxID=32595 RepID=A0AAD9LDA8_BABDI|nr:DNA-directed RNA polymerase subunit beta'' [Babesia divergens]
MCNNIKYYLLEKKLNYNIINKNKYNFNTLKQIYKNFYLIKLYVYLSKYLISIYTNKNNKLILIDKLFEGKYQITNKYINIYKNISIIKFKKIINNYFNYIFLFISININKIFILNNYLTNLNIYNKSLIICPLIFNDIFNINNYIYYIYIFIYLKTFNSYKSSLIALFYYFIGLFLSLFSLYLYNNIKILYSNLIIISKNLSNFITIINYYQFPITVNFILSLKLITLINNSLYLSNLLCYNYKPFLMGITNYTNINTGILSKLSFQNTLKILQTIILKDKFEWNIDTKSSLIISNFISTGSGWYRYF